MKFYCLFTQHIHHGWPWLCSHFLFCGWRLTEHLLSGTQPIFTKEGITHWLLELLLRKWCTSISLTIYWPKQVTWPCLSSESVGKYNPPTGSGTKHRWSVIPSTTSAFLSVIMDIIILMCFENTPKGSEASPGFPSPILESNSSSYDLVQISLNFSLHQHIPPTPTTC